MYSSSRGTGQLGVPHKTETIATAASHFQLFNVDLKVKLGAVHGWADF